MIRTLPILILLCLGCANRQQPVAVITPQSAPMPIAMESAAVGASTVIAPPERTVTLTWYYRPEDVTPDLVFNLYRAVDLARPLATWPLLAVIPGSDRSVTIPAMAACEFFTLTASNQFGESKFSQ